MCGRFSLFIDPELFLRTLGYEGNLPHFTARYNITPDQKVTVFTAKRSIHLMPWGLVPFFSKDGKMPLINARIETAAQKPSFRRSFEQGRCIVPATGFFEWKQKQPYHITTNERVFGFAALYDSWQDEKSVCLLTRDALPEIAPIHHRMPIMMSPEQSAAWLEGGAAHTLKNINIRAVSRKVNQPKHDGPSCLASPDPDLFD